MNVRILTILVCSIFFSVPVSAEEWHGLIPGRSTRQDVVPVLGECLPSARECEFNLSDEDVFVTFAASDTCASHAEGRVLLIQRDFVSDASFESLNLNHIRFKKFDPSYPHANGYQGFINEELGLAVKTFNKRIIQVAYFPGSKERQFCSAYYAKPREFVDAPVEHAPNLYVKCPKGPVSAGARLIFTTEYIRGLSILLTWNATAGNIVEGQGRRRMMLDTAGLNGKTIKVSVERMDSTGHVAWDACEIQFKE